MKYRFKNVLSWEKYKNVAFENGLRLHKLKAISWLAFYFCLLGYNKKTNPTNKKANLDIVFNLCKRKFCCKIIFQNQHFCIFDV